MVDGSWLKDGWGPWRPPPTLQDPLAVKYASVTIGNRAQLMSQLVLQNSHRRSQLGVHGRIIDRQFNVKITNSHT